MLELRGRTVLSIVLNGIIERDREHAQQLIEQKTQQPLDPAKIRKSIKNLFATGMYENVLVTGREAPGGGVDITFSFVPNFFIGDVEVQGLPKNLSPNQLVDASNLHLGDLFTPERLALAVGRMKKVMEDNGYYQAAIASNHVPDPEKHQTNIYFQVNPGPQARVGKIIVEGDSKLSSEEVQKIGHLHSGKKVKAQSVTRALQHLRKYFQKKGLLEAQTSVLARTFNQTENTVDYTFRIEPGPVVQIRSEGASISTGTLKKYVPVYEEGAVDDDLLNEGKRNLQDYMQTIGYFDAKVSYTRQNIPEKNQLNIIYDVDRGERHKLLSVKIDGNKYFSDDLIRERMMVQPAGRLFSHGRFSQGLLNRDIASITGLYQTNGFRKVQVVGKVQDSVEGNPANMIVEIQVTEGPQFLVENLNIEGNASIPAKELTEQLTTIQGQPFSETNVAQDRDLLLSYYLNRGFPDVQVNPAYEPSKSGTDHMDVTFQVTEGKKVTVDQVFVSGLDHTKSYVVNREIEVKPGDPLSQAALLESQRGLYDLGIFNEVEMAVQNPEGGASTKNVLFQLREAKRYTFNYGFGMEIGTGINQAQGTSPQGEVGVSPRVSFDMTRLNFRGRDQTILLKTQLGYLQQLALLSFESPRFFDLQNWKWTISGFYNNSRGVNTFTSQRLEFATQLEQKVNRAVTALYGFSYRKVKASDFPPGFDFDPSQYQAYQPVRVGMPTFAIIRDFRDDPIDSTKGNYTIVNGGVASKAFGSEANFARIFMQNSTYHLFRKKYILARSTRVGFEGPFGSSTAIPIPEEFFEGGGNSHRGFSINQAGPRDLGSGTPLGGNSVFINNLELRLPPVLVPYIKQNIGFVIFHDMGNVFATSSDLFHNFFRWNQKNQDTCKAAGVANPPPNPNPCDFSYMVHAVGTGVRYKTPIGPIRADIGYNLNPPVFVVQNPTSGPPRYEYLRRWNVFVSIGQTF